MPLVGSSGGHAGVSKLTMKDKEGIEDQKTMRGDRAMQRAGEHTVGFRWL